MKRILLALVVAFGIFSVVGCGGGTTSTGGGTKTTKP
jgi:hypothetical protein